MTGPWRVGEKRSLKVSSSHLRSNAVTSGLPWRMALAAMLCVFMAACTVLPKRLTYRRANVVAYGERRAGVATRASYDRIEIGTPEQPFRGEPALTLLLDDGSSLRTDRLDVAVLRERAQRITLEPKLWIDQGRWPQGVEEIAIDGYRFLVLDDAVVAVLMATRWDFDETTPPPTIAGPDAAVHHRLPLDLKSLVSLFGEPETLSEDVADLL